MSDEAVSNSTCLIGLERIGRLQILPRVYRVLFVPQAVVAEFGNREDWFCVRAVSNRHFVDALRTQLGDGEAEAIALAA